MLSQLLVGLALMLVFEGILPFLSPEHYRNMLRQLSTQSDQTLRFSALAVMIAGLILLSFLV